MYLFMCIMSGIVWYNNISTKDLSSKK
jgi:hypothetical protein